MTTELSTEVSGIDTAGLFDPASEEIFQNPEERTLMATLLSLNDRVDLALPDGMPAAELWRTFDICARVFVRVRHASGQLKLLIGRALAVIQNTPEIYESRGFRSFDDFMTNEDRGLPFITGISRAELYKSKAVAKSVGPAVNLETVREIGFTKLQLVAGVAQAGDSHFEPLLEHARTDTIPQLRERIERQGLSDADETVWDVITIPVTRAQKDFFSGFLKNPQVRAYCESESAGIILERAISEVIGEWGIERGAADSAGI